jgi:hypothetical protein
MDNNTQPTEKSTNIYDDLLNDELPAKDMPDSTNDPNNIKDTSSPSNPNNPKDTIDNTEIAAQINELKIQLKNIKSKDGPKKIKAPAKVKKPQLTDDNNLLLDTIEAQYKMSIATDDDAVLSPPILTTSTISGQLSNSNVSSLVVDIYEPDEHVVVIKSNFGKLVYPGYVEASKEKVKVSNRGRKIKPKAKKERKKQGTGTCFNSQITFIVKTDIPDPQVPSGFKEFLFKVFAHDKFQLPGVKENEIDKIKEACTHIIRVINKANAKKLLNDIKAETLRLETTPGNSYLENIPPAVSECKLTSLCFDMKNYKFFLKMGYAQILDLSLLKKILLTIKMKEDPKFKVDLNHVCAEVPINANPGINRVVKKKICELCYNKNLFNMEIAKSNYMDFPYDAHPEIFDISFTREDTKLSIWFSTPLKENSDKKLLVKIFKGSIIPNNYGDMKKGLAWGSKINILGGYKYHDTVKVYNFLLDVFERYYDYLVVDQEIKTIDGEEEYEYDYADDSSDEDTPAE